MSEKFSSGTKKQRNKLISRKHFARTESQLLVKCCNILAYAWHLRSSIREGYLSCQICCDMGPFYPKDRLQFSRLIRQTRGTEYSFYPYVSPEGTWKFSKKAITQSLYRIVQSVFKLVIRSLDFDNLFSRIAIRSLE